MTSHLTGPLVARKPDDLIAMVPLVLGFAPHESLTLLTFAADRPFHARVDLPDDPRHDEEVAEVLLAPARRHAVRSVALVLHSDHDEPARRVARCVLDALLDDGIAVVDVVRADGERYWCLDCTEAPPGDRCAGHRYDVSAHPFVAEAVWAGQVVLSSRAELAATVAPGPDDLARRARVAAAARRHGWGLAARDVAREAGWVRRTLRRHLAAGTRPDDDRLGRLLADLAVGVLRDVVRERLDRASASTHVDLWRDAVRRAPEELLGPVAGVLAHTAWLAGDGALAWCVLDRARDAGAEHDLLDLVADLLTRAVPPTVVPSVVASTGEVGSGRPA